MNTMRVYLHDLLWQQDPEGFKRRLNEFLTIAAGTESNRCSFSSTPFGIRTRSLASSARRPGVHNSGWVQSPSRATLQNESEYPRLKEYVKGVVGAFARDQRFLRGTSGTSRTT